MRLPLWNGLLFCLACATPAETAGPASTPTDHLTLSGEETGQGLLVEVDTRDRSLTVHHSNAAPAAPVFGDESVGPSFSLLDDQAIDLHISNYSASGVGAYTPGMTRIRFDVQVANRLTSVELLPPDLGAVIPAPTLLMLLPFLQDADTGAAPVYTGGDASVIVDRSRAVLVSPSADWDGGGTLGTSGYDFVRGVLCVSGTPGCSRWEGYAPLEPGTASAVQTVGFDVAPTVGRFRVRLLLSASLRAATDTAAINLDRR